MSKIERHKIGQRMSQVVIHGGTVYLAGQVGTPHESVTEQTREILGKIESLLATARSDPTRLLQAIIWLEDMRDFDEMNAVWDAWVPQGQAPARACGQASLAVPGLRVEITVTAAVAESSRDR